ncbi:unnamed protein product [Meganyctiphanes norvegica]|uniref:IGFBP N-terminal domain-containing protein n=1 Tax=Meganyctiphanes norvegica TaxID=48144 RepID=A0AAV2PFR6_MEGNR
MAIKLFLFIFILLCLVLEPSMSLSCGPCNRSACGSVRHCRHGSGRQGLCGCCRECLKGPGETCGGRWEMFGRCGRRLICDYDRSVGDTICMRPRRPRWLTLLRASLILTSSSNFPYDHHYG